MIGGDDLNLATEHLPAKLVDSDLRGHHAAGAADIGDDAAHVRQDPDLERLPARKRRREAPLQAARTAPLRRLLILFLRDAAAFGLLSCAQNINGSTKRSISALLLERGRPSSPVVRDSAEMIEKLLPLVGCTGARKASWSRGPTRARAGSFASRGQRNFVGTRIPPIVTAVHELPFVHVLDHFTERRSICIDRAGELGQRQRAPSGAVRSTPNCRGVIDPAPCTAIQGLIAGFDEPDEKPDAVQRPVSRELFRCDAHDG